MKKLSYLIVLALILGLVLTGCLLSNVGQVPTTQQSGITYLTKGSSPGLVGLWHFDEEVGTTASDSSGNGNTGTLVNGPQWVAGKFGNALSFDGATTTYDYISVADSDSLDMTATNELTIEAWVYSTDPSNNQQIVDKGEHAYSSGYMLMIYGGNLYGRVNKEDVATACIHPYPTDGDWHHVAYTFKSGEQKLYLDGNPVVTKTGVTIIKSNDNPLFIGNGVARLNVYEWMGTIDEVRIWNTALTADQLILYDGFSGLLAPYKGPPKAFKSGSSIPLKWQYTDLFGTAVKSFAVNPSVEIKPVESNGEPVEGTPIVVDDPGSSGYHYDSETNTWHFNWQTKDREAGDYNIYIINDWTGQTFGPYPIQLR